MSGNGVDGSGIGAGLGSVRKSSVVKARKNTLDLKCCLNVKKAI